MSFSTKPRNIGPADKREPPHVLLVDDDVAFARALSRLIGLGEHYQVTTAHSMTEAIRKVRSRPVQAVIVDAWIPGGGGTALLSRLRSSHPQIRRVLMAADPIPALEFLLLKQVVEHFFAKHAGHELLIEWLDQACGVYRPGTHPPGATFTESAANSVESAEPEVAPRETQAPSAQSLREQLLEELNQTVLELCSRAFFEAETRGLSDGLSSDIVRVLADVIVVLATCEELSREQVIEALEQACLEGKLKS